MLERPLSMREIIELARARTFLRCFSLGTNAKKHAKKHWRKCRGWFAESDRRYQTIELCNRHGEQFATVRICFGPRHKRRGCLLRGVPPQPWRGWEARLAIGGTYGPFSKRYQAKQWAEKVWRTLEQ